MITKKRRPLWLIAIILLISIAGIAAVIITINSRKFKGEVLRDEKVTVELTHSTHAQQLAYENEYVIVTVGCDQYLAYLDIEISNETLPESIRADDEELRKKIETTNSCEGKGISLGEYTVANMLEKGMASVYDKCNQVRVATVTIWYYEFICGPLCGQGTRSFYLPDGTMFLDVQDWIS
jgi:hypothetical protein